MHALLDRYTDVCGAVIERHGGTVEGFIGDAVVGVFGQTELHEDDALRAVRAAVELREAGAALSAELERERGVGIGMKLGVESGEVFVSAGRAPLAVRRRRRLQRRGAARGRRARGRDPARRQRLPPGSGRRAGRAPGAARAEGPGGEGPGLAAARAGAATGSRRSVRRQPLRGPRARARRAARPPSRARARRAGLPARSPWSARPGSASRGSPRSSSPRLGDDATVVVGRCLSYGEGVDLPPAGRDRRPARRRRPAAARRRAARGRRGRSRGWCWPRSACPTGRPRRRRRSWAVRRLLERVARERPLVVVVEDVHWARADAARPARVPRRLLERAPDPARLPRAARPPGDARPPGWPRSRTGRCWSLDALSDAEARRLVESAGAEDLGSGTAARIVETAEGNPLFLEQLVAVGRRPARRAAVEHPGGARRAHRPPRARRARRARARLGPGPQLLRRRRRGAAAASASERSVAAAPGLARPQAADPRRPLRAPGPGRVPLRARADPRGRVRRAAQAAARGAARARGALARSAGRAPRTRRSATTSARPTATGPSSASWASTSGRWRPRRPSGSAAAAGAALAARRSRRRARACSSARRRCWRPTIRPAPSCCPSSARRCSTRAGWPTPTRVLTEAIERAPAETRAWRHAPTSSASSCDSRRRRARPVDDARGSRTPRCAVLEAARRRARASAGRWLLRAELAWIEGRGRTCRRGLARGRRARAPRGQPAGAVRGHGLARRGRRVRARRRCPRRSAVCEEFREQVRSQPRGADASTLNAAGLAARDGGRLREAPPARRRRRRDPPRARRPARRRSRSRRRSWRCSPGEPAAEERLRSGTRGWSRWARRRCSPRPPRCSRRPSTPRAATTRPRELCRVSEGAAAADDLSAQVDLARRAREAARRAGRATRRRRSRARRCAWPSRPTSSRSAPMRCSTWPPSSAAATGMRSEADESIHAALALYEQKGDVVSAERARSMLTLPSA